MKKQREMEGWRRVNTWNCILGKTKLCIILVLRFVLYDIERSSSKVCRRWKYYIDIVANVYLYKYINMCPRLGDISNICYRYKYSKCVQRELFSICFDYLNKIFKSVLSLVLWIAFVTRFCVLLLWNILFYLGIIYNLYLKCISLPVLFARPWRGQGK